jgi:hypothetical protein
VTDKRELWDELMEDDLRDSWADDYEGGFDDDDEF